MIKLPANNPIENVHAMFCKQLLGVQKCKPNNGVLLEVGRTPPKAAEKAAVKNWERIHNGRTNYFMKMSFIAAQTDALDWLTKIKMCIAQTGIDNFFVNVGKSPDKNFHHIYFKRVKDAFYQKALSSINNPNGKLRTYNLYKQS